MRAFFNWLRGPVGIAVLIAIITGIVSAATGVIATKEWDQLHMPPPPSQHPSNTIITNLMYQEIQAAKTQSLTIVTSIYDSNAVVTDVGCRLPGQPRVWSGIESIWSRYQSFSSSSFPSLQHNLIQVTWQHNDASATQATATAETVGVMVVNGGTPRNLAGGEFWTFALVKDKGWRILTFTYNLCAPLASKPGSAFDCKQSLPESTKPILAGLAYGASHAGQDPNIGLFPSNEEVKADMPTLASISNHIRIYSSTGPAAAIVQSAEAAHVCVTLGIALGHKDPENQKEITAGEELALNRSVSAIVVGNEVLPNNVPRPGDLPVEQVRAAIQQVRATLHDLVPITVADEYYVWLQHLDLLNDVDFVTIHIYPFWDKCSIDSAIQCLNTAYQKFQQAVHTRFPHMQIVIGETGWPSNGPPYGAAVPGPANQARYLRDFTNWARLYGVQYYYFDAFDESWKGTIGNGEYGVGANWGIYQKDGVLKPTLSGLLPVAAAETLHERSYLDLYVGTGLEECFSLGLDTSGQQRAWLTDTRGSLLLVYPPGQQWGTMYITASSPFPKCQRPSLDLSAYHSLVFDMRAAVNGQCVHVGIKDVSQPPNGSEITKQECLTTQWSTFTLPLLSTFPNVDLSHLYVLFEVNFAGPSSVTIELSNIRYSPI